MNGWKTYLVCAIYVAAGLSAEMGWVPDPATAAGLDSAMAQVVSILRQPIVAGGVFALMRWWTERTTVKQARLGLH